MFFHRKSILASVNRVADWDKCVAVIDTTHSEVGGPVLV